jgi:hypothetical protein
MECISLVLSILPSRSWSVGTSALLKRLESLAEGLLHFLELLLGELGSFSNARSDFGEFFVEAIVDPLPSFPHPIYGHLIEKSSRDGIQLPDLSGNGNGAILFLLQNFSDPASSLETTAGFRIEPDPESRETLELFELGEGETQLAGNLLIGRKLCVTSYTRNGLTNVDSRQLAPLEELWTNEDLPIGDRDKIGRDIGGNILRLRLNDGKRCEGPPAVIVSQMRRALEQT